MYSSTFLKIIFVISLCFLTLNIEAHYRNKHCHHCQNTLTITKTKSKCYFTKTETKTNTKTKTVTAPASTITSPPKTETITTTKTLTITTTATCIPSGSPCDLDNPGACCSLTCINGFGCA